MLDYATTRLSTEFETKIEIGSIDYRFFNTLALKDVYIEDQQQDTLLFVEELNANFEFWKFFKNKLVFSQLEFDGLRGHIKSDGQGNTNLDFFFKNLDKEKESAFIDLKLEKFKIKNSYLSYNNLSDSTESLLFNPNHIHLSRLNTEITVREFNKDSININIRYLNAQEGSGLKLENLSLKAYGSPRGITIPELSIELPESKIKLSPASMKFDSYEDFNDFANKIIFEIPVRETTLSFHDLAAFVPGFRGLHEIIKVDALLTGRLASLRLQNMKVEYGKSFRFDADLDVNGLPNLEESFFYGTVNQLQIKKTELEDLVARIDNRPFVLPKEFNQLGLISYRGNITGFLSDLVAYGNLNTNIGSISSDISIKFQNQLQDISYNGRLRTNNLALGKFFNDTVVGKIAIDLNTTGTKLMHQPFKGTLTARVAELEFNKYNYKNATFDGEYDGSGFNGQILIDDENINADFYGIIDFRNPKVPVFDFNLELNNTNLYALNLIQDYPDSRISFKGNTNMSGSSLDNLNGTLQFRDIVFSNKSRTLNGNEILFTSRTGINYTHFQIQSDYVNGSFSGDFKYSSIGNTFRKVLSRYLPSLSTNGKRNGNTNHLPNNIHVDLTLDNLQEIAQVFYLPYVIEGATTIRGDIDEAKNEIELISNISNIKTNKQIFENITIRLENQGQQLQLTGRTQMQDINSGLMNVFFSANAARDKLLAKFIWQNNKEITNAGEIDTETLFSRTDDAISAHTHFNPTQIIISDSIWDIRSSDVFFSSDSMITINNFLFDNGRQFFHIDGVASRNRSDSVTVSMNDLNLDYIMELVRLDGISFSGVTTGKLQLFSLLKEPIFLADLAVKDFKLNDHIMGNAWVKTSWDKPNSQLLIDGFLTNDELDILAEINGVFIPGVDSLELNIESRELSTGFLNRYFEGVASKVDGKGEGWVHIYGPLKDIKIEADVFVTDGRATIDMLKTVYHFNDRVILTSDKILINNITIYDEENNPARASGFISHNGSFKNMLYDVKINTENILAMNTRSTDDDFFYGKAYVGGLVHIFGNDEEANIVVNGVTRPKTSCYMSMGSTSSVLENDFIRFIEQTVENYRDDFNDEENPLQFASTREFNVKVDMQIEVTPEAVMEILVDPSGGDKITGRGRGNIRILFDTFSDVEIYGTVELEQGSYLFTLQTVIRKEFKINEGSTIAFTGDPFGAQANINGYYGLTASLADLIEREELQQITSRSTVPVHCLMNLTEDLMAPTIRFNIDLPSSDESIKSRVRNVINTDEMMNRQILYLLLFHKFFTPDDIRATNTPFAFSEGFSFAAATLSSQINSWIQNSLNTDIFSFGLDWQKADAVSDEFKAQILIQPNNRLVINGNIGYRNDDISENKFIGDFDLEYKLIESGKLRFTAYNHTIDRAQLREAKTTQGVGLIYREDFNNLREMIDYYWNAVRGIFTPKPKKEEANL